MQLFCLLAEVGVMWMCAWVHILRPVHPKRSLWPVDKIAVIIVWVKWWIETYSLWNSFKSAVALQYFMTMCWGRINQRSLGFTPRNSDPIAREGLSICTPLRSLSPWGVGDGKGSLQWETSPGKAEGLSCGFLFTSSWGFFLSTCYLVFWHSHKRLSRSGSWIFNHTVSSWSSPWVISLPLSHLKLRPLLCFLCLHVVVILLDSLLWTFHAHLPLLM